MRIELKVPSVGESITEVELGEWLKRPGEPVRQDEPLVTLESEKATVELPAPESGTLGEVLKQKGAVAQVGEVIAYLETEAAAAKAQKAAEAKPSAPAAHPKPALAEAKSREPGAVPATKRESAEPSSRVEALTDSQRASGTPKESLTRRPEPAGEHAKPVSLVTQAQAPPPTQAPATLPAGREEEVVPMSRLRRTVAERLVEAQHNAALLTTFNEIDMGAVMALRKEHGEAFQQKYRVKLGFMSFFVKACVDALKQFPELNAEVRGTSIVYHNFYDIGVAIGSGKGLVVPVLRNAERLSFAEIELAIGDFALRARENKLTVEELQGGTFTVSNGGVYGSLLSTPIVNPPQSGVLGLHAIQERPVAREGNVVIRPMMYVALTYDHRVVDGREAVSFLKRIKEVIETPTRMLMEV